VRAAQIVELSAAPRVVEVDGVDGFAIEAVALNPLDVSVWSGVFYGGHPPLPYIPGCEAVGRSAGGERFYLFGEGRGIGRDGFLAERVDFPDGLAMPLPAGTEPALGAASGIAGVAGWVPVAWKAKVVPGDRVLVLGGTGAAGQVAVQAARLLGAEQVVGVGRNDLDRIPEELGPDGFTVCIDMVWGEPLANALAHAARHARIVHVGQSAGPQAPLRSADVRSKELVIQGHSNFALSHDDLRRAQLELLEHAAAGRIVIPIERYPLDRVAEAWERQRSGPGGKVVVEL
jgi:NADPH2:quinone reductase